MVQVWNADPKNSPNPYEEPTSGAHFYFVLNLSPAHRIIHSGTTLADVKRELNKEEDEEMKNGVLPLHQVSSVQFLTTGLEIEEQQ